MGHLEEVLQQVATDSVEDDKQQRLPQKGAFFWYAMLVWWGEDSVHEDRNPIIFVFMEYKGGLNDPLIVRLILNNNKFGWEAW